MDIVECVGFEKSKLTADQVSKLTAFIESQAPGDLLSLRVYPNLDTTSEEELPTGMVAIFAPNAVVDATVIGDNMFQLMAVSRINAFEGIKDEYFESKLDSLKGSIDQFSPTPVSSKIRNRKTNKEIDVWAPELGGTGSFVGIYSKLQEDHRTKDYFVAARSTVPLIVQDLKREIAAEKPTYIDLVTGEEWNRKIQYGTHVAQRNVKRAIANAAEACGVEVTRMDDIFVKRKSPNHAPPEMAVPEWEQTTHAILPISHLGKPAVMFTYGVVPASECLMLKDQHFFVASNPFDGITLFNLSKYNGIESSGGIPADTGRKMASEKLSSNAAAFVGRTQGIVWDNKTRAEHADLHVDAFKPVGADFKEAMKGMGWNPESHVSKLVRVAVKIYNPELKRK